MCGAPQEEHKACQELLGYCPYCEKAVPYPAPPEMPLILVVSGQ